MQRDQRAKKWRLWLSIGLACALIVQPVLGQRELLAAFGPCNITSPPSFLNTIACGTTACTGSVNIVPQQSACGNTNKDACTNTAQPVLIMYGPVATYSGNWTYFTCCWQGPLCGIASLGTIACTAPAGPALVVCAVGIVGVLCWALSGGPCNACCYNTCSQDIITPPLRVPGGNYC